MDKKELILNNVAVQLHDLKNIIENTKMLGKDSISASESITKIRTLINEYVNEETIVNALTFRNAALDMQLPKAYTKVKDLEAKSDGVLVNISVAK